MRGVQGLTHHPKSSLHLPDVLDIVITQNINLDIQVQMHCALDSDRVGPQPDLHPPGKSKAAAPQAPETSHKHRTLQSIPEGANAANAKPHKSRHH